MSLDSWASAATIIRNLSLNWLLFLPAFLLIVAIPKMLLHFFIFVRHWAKDDGSLFLWGSRGFYLLATAALLYAVSEFFTSAQLVCTQGQGETPPPTSPPRCESDDPSFSSSGGFGANDLQVACCNISLIFVSAYLAATMLVGSIESDLKTYLWSMSTLALIWSASFLLVWLFATVIGRCRWNWRWLWLVLARAVGGAGVGAGLAWGFSLFEWSPEWMRADSFRLTLAILVGLLAHFIGCVLFSGVTSLIWDSVDRDAVREWMARVGGLFIFVLIGWMIYAALTLRLPLAWSGDGVSSVLKRVDVWLAPLGVGAGLAAAYFGFSKASGQGKAVRAAALSH